MAPGLSLPSPALQQEHRSILSEPDPDVRGQALLSLGGRLETDGQHAAAAAVFREIEEELSTSEAAGQAHAALEALGGKGGFGRRFELQTQQWFRQAADPRFLAPMLAGSLAFQIGRTAWLGRLAAIPEASFWSRGLGARGLAALGGFALELPAFTLSQRLLVPGPESLGHDFQKAALTLGALKVFSFAGQQAVRGMPSAVPLVSFTRAAAPSATALLGLMSVHWAEAGLGWRAHSDFGSLFAESLFSLTSLKVGNALGSAVLGPRFTAWQTELELGIPINREMRRLSNPAALALVAGVPLQPTAKPVESTLSMMASGHDPLSKSGWIRKGSPWGENRNRPNFASSEQALKSAQRLRREMMDPSRRSWERYRSLETLATFFTELKDPAEIAEGLRNLQSLIGQPEIQHEHRVVDPTQAVTFYGHDHLLRVRAAELYLKALRDFPRPAEERERFAEFLRKTIEDPQIPTKYRSIDQSRGWEEYYLKNVANLQCRLLSLYASAVRQLRMGSAEVLPGIRFLASQPVQNLWTNSDVGFLANTPKSVALAYAALLTRVSRPQFERSQELKGDLAVLFPRLETPILEGDEEALWALVKAAPHEPVAGNLLTDLKTLHSDPWLQYLIRRFEAEIQG